MMTGDVSINRGPHHVRDRRDLMNIAMCEGRTHPWAVVMVVHTSPSPRAGGPGSCPCCACRARCCCVRPWETRPRSWESARRRELTVVARRSGRCRSVRVLRAADAGAAGAAAAGRGPVYVVHFSQREASELAQDLVSLSVADRPQRDAIAREISGTRFDSVFGPELKRILRSGVGVHHAGMLPRYRRLVERLAQAGLLQVVCGTDTLGVGINVPIRTVLFSKLCKYAARRPAAHRAGLHESQAARAGGALTQGWVVARKPAHVIENKRLEEKAKASGKRSSSERARPSAATSPGMRSLEQLIAALRDLPLDSPWTTGRSCSSCSGQATRKTGRGAGDTRRSFAACEIPTSGEGCRRGSCVARRSCFGRCGSRRSWCSSGRREADISTAWRRVSIGTSPCSTPSRSGSSRPPSRSISAPTTTSSTCSPSASRSWRSPT